LTAKIGTAKRRNPKKMQDILNPSMAMTAPDFLTAASRATLIYADFG
jgi:hypothetical protein